MKIYGCFLLLISFGLSSAFANFPEFFGTGYETSALGNQSTSNPENPSNVYYAPALMAFSAQANFHYSMSGVTTSFEEINSVVTKNDATVGDSETGSVDTEVGEAVMQSIHFSLPILSRKSGGKLAGSVYIPIDSFVDQSTGDAFNTEYVMYRSRYKRLIIFLNYAFQVSNEWALSLGFFTGMQVSSTVNNVQSLNSTNVGGSGSLRAKAKPSIAAVLGAARKTRDSLLYFTFHQQMKNNLRSDAGGETSNPPLPYDITLETMLSYDPHILRAGYAFNLSQNLELLSSFEYQLWDDYQTPVIRIVQNGGTLNGSENFETITTANIFVPRLGLKIKATDDSHFNLGAGYRPTPLEGDFSGSGNSVDTDKLILSGGYNSNFEIFSKKLNWGTSLQYHKLFSKDVTKTSGQEDGNAGSKVGAPGYTIGGHILALSFGVQTGF